MTKKFRKLKRTAMRKLDAGVSLTEHGIIFERMQNGDGRFSVNVMVDGRRIHRVIGCESEKVTLTQAVDFIAQIRTEARQDRLGLPQGRKTILSFKEAAEKYLEMLKQEDGRDIKGKRRKLNQHLIPFFGNMPLVKITSFQIERYKKFRRGAKAMKSHDTTGRSTYKNSSPAPGTINRELAVISHLFSKAREWGWITLQPKINRFKEDSGRIIYLTVEQIRNLIECAKADGSPQIYPFVVIGLDTSLRMSNILSIRKEHIDLQRRVIYIPKSKNGMHEQPITVHLAEFLAGYIIGLQEGCPWLFPSPASRTGHTVNLRNPFRRVVEAAGLDPDLIVRHTLRHTAITHLVQAGVDLPTIMRISSHKTLAMVQRYAHQNGEHIQQAMDKLETRYQSQG